MGQSPLHKTSELRRVLVPLLPFAERNKSNCLVSNGKVADNLSKAERVPNKIY
jgi:hypothetical protein